MTNLQSKENPEIKIIAGLGNPGAAYKNTYHNVGILALEWLVKNCGDASPWKKVDDLFEYVELKNIVWVKPSVFMNESGRALAKAKKYFSASAQGESASGGKIRTENILVIHDDSDLRVGDFKIAFNKSSAGHKGVESIMDSLHSARFSRIRIGVRDRKNKKKALDFILKKISPAHREELNGVFEKIPGLLVSRHY